MPPSSTNRPPWFDGIRLSSTGTCGTKPVVAVIPTPYVLAMDTEYGFSPECIHCIGSSSGHPIIETGSMV
ncbi:Uncharacterized protein HZ326_12248 [Fusarium oxysporum f. sp. albedinis]|nr:Uncharacterized protein HZ326_12248 [Fusarium oxysporum f. sp. albedinis]